MFGWLDDDAIRFYSLIFMRKTSIPVLLLKPTKSLAGPRTDWQAKVIYFLEC